MTECCKRRDQLQPVHLKMTSETVKKIKEHLIWFFETTAPENQKDEKRVEIVKIRIKQILCGKHCFLTGLRFYDFILLFSVSGRVSPMVVWVVHGEGERKQGRDEGNSD